MATRQSANDIAHGAINDKLDRLIVTTDRIVDTVSLHREILAKQEITLSEHVQRTHLLEVEVKKLDKFRNKVTGIVAFVVAASAAVASWFNFVK